MRRAAAIALVLLGLVAFARVAHAYYVAQVTATVEVRAAALPAGPMPTVELRGRTASVSWPSAVWADGALVSAYALARGGTGPAAASPAGGGCAGMLTALSCAEARLPAGTWRYAVTPRAGTVWAGTAGPASAAIVVPAPALALARAGVLGVSLPQAASGSLTGFDAGEAITWRLDDPATGAVLAGTPAADADGTAAVSVTIPAGTAEGAHVLYATGTAPDASRSSAALVVDLTPPVTADSSAAIGSSWRRTASVALTAADAGSGVAATYWTSDGSTPTTASATGTSVPLNADGVYTVRYFSVDVAGNREAVRASATSIRIDATPPAVAAPSGGGAVLRAGSPLTTTASDPTAGGVSSGVASVAYSACPGTCTPTPGGVGTIALGSSTTGPDFAIAWPSALADGAYTVQARATDVAGNVGISAVATRTVDNAPPKIATALADAAAQQAGYINGNADFHVYANVADAGSGPDPTTVRADLSGQCGSACAAVALTTTGGPFTLVTAAGPVTYAYRSAVLRAAGSPTTSYAVSAADLAGTAGSASGSVTIDYGGKPGAPTAVSLVNGATATGFATCVVTPNGALNAANAGTATVQVQTASNAPANGVVVLTATVGTGSVSARVVQAAAGAQTATFAGLDLSGLGDGTLSLSAFEYTPGGKSTGSATAQAVTKLTVPPVVTTASLSYTDNVAPAADQASSSQVVGPVDGYLAFTQTAGTSVGAVYASTALATGRLAALALASETSSPTYAVRAADRACNQGPAATWTPTAVR